MFSRYVIRDSSTWTCCHGLLNFYYVGRVEDGAADFPAGLLQLRARKDLALGVAFGISHANSHQEAIELRLGQGISAVVLDGILRGKLLRMAAAADMNARRLVTCPSFMASSRADCVFGVVRLISSANRTLAKTGPRLNSNFCSMAE